MPCNLAEHQSSSRGFAHSELEESIYRKSGSAKRKYLEGMQSIEHSGSLSKGLFQYSNAFND